MLEEVTTKVDNAIDENSIDIDNFPNANDMKAISKLKYLELYKKESTRLITLASESIFNSAKSGKLSTSIYVSNDNNATNEAIKKVVDFFEKKYYYVPGAYPMLPCCEFQGRISRGFRFWRRECTGEASGSRWH